MVDSDCGASIVRWVSLPWTGARRLRLHLVVMVDSDCGAPGCISW